MKVIVLCLAVLEYKQIYYLKMIPSHRFTVSQEETNCIYMPLLHQVMKWNTSCTLSLIHCPALSAAAAIPFYHVLKILKDYGCKKQRSYTVQIKHASLTKPAIGHFFFYICSNVRRKSTTLKHL